MGLREQDTSALAGANSTSSPEEATPRFITQMENGQRVTYEQLDMFNSPRADVWTFGFPCQDISAAGKQRGLAGERSGLFYEIIRLLAGTRAEDRPKWIIAENVKNLLSIGRGFDFARVLCALGEVGYECEWQLLNSKDFGVPQNRERVFIVGHLGGIGARKVFPVAAADGENPCELQEITQGVAVADAYRVYNSEGLSRPLKGKAGGLGAKTGLYAIDLSYKAARITKTARCLQARYNKGPCNRESETTGVLIAPVLTPEREEKRQNGRRMKEPGEPMFTLTAQDRHGIAIVQRGHGFNAGGEHDIAPALTCASCHENNMVKVSGLYTNCRDDFYRGPLEGLSRTLKGSKHDAAVTDGVRIRKLTPRECWRLQGFPDEYFDRAVAADVSDSQLYKQAGNAVTVNVAEAIGRKLKEIEDEIN